MITFDSLLIAIIAGTLTFKVVLLALATILFIHGLSQRVSRSQAAPVPAPGKHRELDVYV